MGAEATKPEEPGFLQRALNNVAQIIEADRKKRGGMTFGAMFRLGVAELREAVSLGGNIQPPTPLGMYGTLTPGEVGAARDNDAGVRQMNEEPLPSPGHLAASQVAPPPGQDHGHARGRGM
jgi:hypothetical protein